MATYRLFNKAKANIKAVEKGMEVQIEEYMEKIG